MIVGKPFGLFMGDDFAQDAGDVLVVIRPVDAGRIEDDAILR